MPRIRKRDWPQMVYKFDTKVIGQMPKEVIDTAYKMRNLWNALVDLRDQISEEAKQFEDKTQQKEVWKQFDDKASALVKESGLNWECGPFVLDKFRVALSRAIKNIKTGCKPEEAGFPKKHLGRLKKFAIPHRYTGGGLPIAHIFSDKTWRSAVKQVQGDAYQSLRCVDVYRRHTTGVFGLSKDCLINFKMELDREFHPEAILKRSTWIANWNGFKWETSIDFTVEVPPAPGIIKTERYCGLDIGWRKFDNYIRVAVVVDNEGNVLEFRLPLEDTGAKKRKIDWYNRFNQDAPVASSFAEIIELESRIGSLVEQIKKDVLPLIPKDLQIPVTAWQKMRQGGLVKLLRNLIELNACQGAITLLEQWKAKNDKLMGRLVAAKKHRTLKREHLYSNIAAFLARRYSVIAWEGDLQIKDIAEDHNKGYALENADVYRQYAAPYDFRQRLNKACNKYQCELVDCKAAYTTQTCAYCGTQIEKSAKLILECGNGHREDQDINAALNLFSQIDGVSIAEFDMRRKVAIKNRQVIDIPSNLVAVAIVVHS